MEVDVVVVSFLSRDRVLRNCVEPLTAIEGVHPIVVDNASPDGSLEVVQDLPIRTIQLDENRGSPPAPMQAGSRKLGLTSSS